ncbi:TPA: restriction endonuclease subunit S [Enterobacter ludwigii]|nr:MULTISPECIES: restriction endonuclease subunit S [Citrobacter]MDM3136484.1 restriction endonuclease subunit S [Citrobacter sp. Cf123]MEB6521865.1 restriction endonuclease subunit S [Citrobacter portucalensis]HDR2528123.1 restriction endonuclease subunit S [Enterobacter ludwigii]
MSMDSKMPEIRFKGFIGEWEEKGLGTDVAEIIGGGTPSTSISEFWDGDIDWYSPTEIGSNVYAEGSQKKITALGLKSSSAKILPAGNTVLFTSRAGIGDMAILARPGATNQGFQSFIVKAGFSPYFIYSAGKQIKDFALKHASGSTFLEISGKQLGRMKILMPSSEEQVAIGNYFQKLDVLINQHQQKHNKLSNIKKSMLEKMFPKKGETIPEIRFKGFSGGWDEISLLDSIERIIDFRGRTPKKLGLDWSPSGYRALSALNVKQGYIDFSIDPHFGDQELYDKWMNGSELHQGQVLFTTEAPMGNVAQVPNTDKYILSQRTIAFVVKFEIIVEDFLAVLLRSYNVFRELSALSSGGTAKGVSQKVLANLNVSIPTDLVEQTAIGNYFQKLDVLINQHQQQITKLNNIKQACLSKMFV